MSFQCAELFFRSAVFVPCQIKSGRMARNLSIRVRARGETVSPIVRMFLAKVHFSHDYLRVRLRTDESTKIVLNRREDTAVERIDIDIESLRRARKDYLLFHFVCAKGEQLPFRAGAFGAVISGVAMPYM